MCIQRTRRAISRNWIRVKSTQGLFLLIYFNLVFSSLVVQNSPSGQNGGAYMDEFAVKVSGGHTVARDIASELGFEFIGQVQLKAL